MDVFKPKVGKKRYSFDVFCFNGLFDGTNRRAVLDKCFERSGRKGLVRSLIPSPLLPYLVLGGNFFREG